MQTKKNDNLIRSTFPKVRVVQRRGEDWFQVDARRKGTLGKQEHYATQKEAVERAKAIAAEFDANGSEGLALSQELRAAALRGERLLAPFGKTLGEAVDFYRDFLQAEKDRNESALISKLANDWYSDKNAGHSRKLKPRTLDGIRQVSDELEELWGKLTIRSVTQEMIEKHLNGLKVSMQRKDNVRNLFGQFFNWAISKKHLTDNPCEGISYTVEKTDVVIFKSDVVKKALEICVARIPDMVVYVAISAFAGLRPGEVEGLTWDNIHLEERTIKVLGSTSKSKETHNVPIEDNLFAWLKAYPGKGLVCPQSKTLARRKQKLHAALGYKAAGQNPTAEEAPQDVWRHSYASHWIAKYNNRATLAEQMANSLAIIKKHYKAVVAKSEMEAYWKIVPGAKPKKNYLPKHLLKAA